MKQVSPPSMKVSCSPCSLLPAPYFQVRGNLFLPQNAISLSCERSCAKGLSPPPSGNREKGEPYNKT
jgi:hypothetical protein